MHAIDSNENMAIRIGNTNERQHKEEDSAHKHYVLIKESVHASQVHQGWDIAEEMIDGPGSAIREMEDIHSVNTRVDRPHYQRSYYHKDTHFFCSYEQGSGEESKQPHNDHRP